MAITTKCSAWRLCRFEQMMKTESNQCPIKEILEVTGHRACGGQSRSPEKSRLVQLAEVMG